MLSRIIAILGTYVCAHTFAAPCPPLADRVDSAEVKLSETVRVGRYPLNTHVALQRAAQSPVLLATAPSGDPRLLWTDGKGAVHFTSLDGAWPPAVTSDVKVPVGRIYDLIAHADGGTVLTMISQAMYLARFNAKGEVVWKTRLISNSSRADFHTGRVAWDGTDYATYYGVSGGGHEGDALTIVASDGKVAKHWWTWGCSHSMDVRIVPSQGTFYPVCISDAYPGKGIYFQHNKRTLASEWGDAAGGTGARLGGMVELGGKMHVIYNSETGTGGKWKVALSSFDTETPFTTKGKQWLTGGVTGEANAKIAVYGKHLLAVWTDVKTGQAFARLFDTAGAAVGGAEAIAGKLDPHEDLKALPNGDLLFASGTTGADRLAVHRIRFCE